MKIPSGLLPVLIPPAAVWVFRHERRIARLGVPLTATGLEDARRMGVRFPEKIRLMEVARIPVFNGPLIRGMSRLFPAVSPHTSGLCLRYGIYIRSEFWGDRQMVAHECVHTAQYERCGGIRAFLHEYFTGCIAVGYPAAPMEQEAILRSEEIPAGGNGGENFR
jgi:hypothetical protein